MSGPDFSHESDDLAAARGCFNGLTLMIVATVLLALPWVL